MIKMKILQVAPYFIPYLGGQERYVYILSRYLVNEGHEVDVITANYPISKEYEKIDGITVHRTKVLMRPLRNPISVGFFKIGKMADDYDLVHMHNEYSFPSLLTAYFKMRKDFPLILTNHLSQINFENNLINTFGNFYNRTMGKAILNQCNAIITLSQAHKEHQISINPEIADRVKIIPNAIDLKRFDQLNTEIAADNDNDEFKLLYIGQIVKRKGLYWLFKAFRILKTEGKKIKLEIIGDGPDENYFKKLAIDLDLQGIVEFKGRVDVDKQIIQAYKNADAFVLPSLSEGLPTVILEALYFGLPVIATDIPGVSDNFKDYITLVPPKDENKLAEVIVDVIKNEGSVKFIKLSKTGKELVEKKYSWATSANKYINTYKEIINH